MIKPRQDFTLRRALLSPDQVATMASADLERVVTQGRIARLLPSLTEQLRTQGELEKVPARVRRHMESASLVFQKQRHDLAYDCNSLRTALASCALPLVLLKGAAYIASDLPVGRGRLITDIDIIVPRQQIEQAERALNAHGWESSKLDAYNEGYYRRWSHEVPALLNRQRGTTLDLHHNILPPTAGPTVRPELLFEELREVEAGIFTLSYRDMVIHSATHLFHEGEFHHGLRDLWDLDRMLRDFPQRQPDFWQGLVNRARALELEQSLFHALNYTQKLFDTPIPAEVASEAKRGKSKFMLPAMDFLFVRAFRPDHPDCRLPLTGLALNLLYIRSHYLRMPIYLLLPHLARKAWMRRVSEKKEALENARESA